MKWADVSSDEESLDDLGPDLDDQEMDGEGDEPLENNVELPPIEERFDLPTAPPFTAFVGSLAFSVKEPEQLKDAIFKAVSASFGVELNLLGARIAIDRRDGKHRGFGYVEMESLEDLKLVLHLNDVNTLVAGRRIQLDTAKQPPMRRQGSNAGSRGGHSSSSSINVDGTKFRGGKYANNNNNNNNNNNRRGGRRSSTGTAGDNNGAPQSRPSLNLKPRSKPMDSSGGKSASSSDIFGGAKARDEGAWEQRRSSLREQKDDATKPSSTTPNANTNANNSSTDSKDQKTSPQDRKSSGRGAGRNSGGRGGGRGRGGARGENNNSRKNNANSASKSAPPEEKPAIVSAQPAVVQPETSEPKVTKKEANNKFAALFDSDSE